MATHSSGADVAAEEAGDASASAAVSNVARCPSDACSFCNRLPRSSLGQGPMARYEPTPNFNPFKKVAGRGKAAQTPAEPEAKKPKNGVGGGAGAASKETTRSPRLGGLQGHLALVENELFDVGLVEDVVLSQLFEETGHTWAHHCCAAWSEGVIQAEDYALHYVDKAVVAGFIKKCFFCQRTGATINCKAVKCTRKFHYPCASASGCFLDIKTLTLLCPEHSYQAEEKAGIEAQCIVCEEVGNVSGQLFCTSCGQHYHGHCLDPQIDTNSVVRAGWQCPDCKICQNCRKPGDDNKMLVCDVCDKGYHTYCLNPVVTEIPKNGWKCQKCRVCLDCWSKPSAASMSEKWHYNFTVCDRCQQQRVSGNCCTVCNRAHTRGCAVYACGQCGKTTHQSCAAKGGGAITGASEKSFLCSTCVGSKEVAGLTAVADRMDEDVSASTAISESNVVSSDYRQPAAGDLESVAHSSKHSHPCEEPPVADVAENTKSNATQKGRSTAAAAAAASGKPTAASKKPQTGKKGAGMTPRAVARGKVFKKRQRTGGNTTERRKNRTKARYATSCGVDPSGSVSAGNRHSSVGGGPPGGAIAAAAAAAAAAVRASGRAADTGACSSLRPHHSHPSSAAAAGSAAGGGASNSDDDHHSSVVLTSYSDEFVLNQDMCVSCGSYGKGSEGALIVCTQCGQCYHPYCVQVKLTAVMLEKGWRCLDCTVCEGCGKPHDEARLLLCDDCDISYHTYCLDPPLGQVPNGSWKCKWCVHCTVCGSTTPGFGCEWQNNYTECGPCSSLLMCPVCFNNYKEDDLVIQCGHCERWLHSTCDGVSGEDDIEVVADAGYHCLYCRPVTGSPEPSAVIAAAKAVTPPTPPPPPPPVQEPSAASNGSDGGKVTSSSQVSSPKPPPEENRTYIIDGVCLSEAGMNQLRSLALLAPVACGTALGGALAKSRNRSKKVRQTHPHMAQLLSKEPASAAAGVASPGPWPAAAAATATGRGSGTACSSPAGGPDLKPAITGPSAAAASRMDEGDADTAGSLLTSACIGSGIGSDDCSAAAVATSPGAEAQSSAAAPAQLPGDEPAYSPLTAEAMAILEADEKKKEKAPHRPKGSSGSSITNIGVGGFVARPPRIRPPPQPKVAPVLGQSADSLTATAALVGGALPTSNASAGDCGAGGTAGSDATATNVVVAPKAKARSRKVRQKNHIEDTYPPYLQEAFFGKSLLDKSKSGEEVPCTSISSNPTASGTVDGGNSPAVVPSCGPPAACGGSTITIAQPSMLSPACRNVLTPPAAPDGVLGPPAAVAAASAAATATAPAVPAIANMSPAVAAVSEVSLEVQPSTSGIAPGQSVPKDAGTSSVMPVVDDVQNIDGDDLKDILTELPGDLHEEDLLKMLGAEDLEPAENQDADGDLNAKGGMETLADVLLKDEIDTKNLEDFLKGILAPASDVPHRPKPQPPPPPPPPSQPSQLQQQQHPKQLPEQQHQQHIIVRSLQLNQEPLAMDHHVASGTHLPVTTALGIPAAASAGMSGRSPASGSPGASNGVVPSPIGSAPHLDSGGQYIQCQPPLVRSHSVPASAVGSSAGAHMDPYSAGRTFAATEQQLPQQHKAGFEHQPDVYQGTVPQSGHASPVWPGPASAVTSAGSMAVSSPVAVGVVPTVTLQPSPVAAATGDSSLGDDAEAMSCNKRSMLKWKEDEELGLDATISPVLYVNTNFADLKTQYPDWAERGKHITKLWRKVPTEERAPYLAKARENRAKRNQIKAAHTKAIGDGKKLQRTGKEGGCESPAASASRGPPSNSGVGDNPDDVHASLQSTPAGSSESAATSGPPHVTAGPAGAGCSAPSSLTHGMQSSFLPAPPYDAGRDGQASVVIPSSASAELAHHPVAPGASAGMPQQQQQHAASLVSGRPGDSQPSSAGVAAGSVIVAGHHLAAPSREVAAASHSATSSNGDVSSIGREAQGDAMLVGINLQGSMHSEAPLLPPASIDSAGMGNVPRPPDDAGKQQLRELLANKRQHKAEMPSGGGGGMAAAGVAAAAAAAAAAATQPPVPVHVAGSWPQAPPTPGPSDMASSLAMARGAGSATGIPLSPVQPSAMSYPRTPMGMSMSMRVGSPDYGGQRPLMPVRPPHMAAQLSGNPGDHMRYSMNAYMPASPVKPDGPGMMAPSWSSNPGMRPPPRYGGPMMMPPRPAMAQGAHPMSYGGQPMGPRMYSMPSYMGGPGPSTMGEGMIGGAPDHPAASGGGLPMDASRFDRPRLGFQSPGMWPEGQFPHGTVPSFADDGSRIAALNTRPQFPAMVTQQQQQQQLVRPPLAVSKQPAAAEANSSAGSRPPIAPSSSGDRVLGDELEKVDESDQLEDLLTPDGKFDLIQFADTGLDGTLAEEHDKNMFDEHLGLGKEDNENEADLNSPTAAVKQEPDDLPAAAAAALHAPPQQNRSSHGSPAAAAATSIAPADRPHTGRGIVPPPPPPVTATGGATSPRGCSTPLPPSSPRSGVSARPAVQGDQLDGTSSATAAPPSRSSGSVPHSPAAAAVASASLPSSRPSSRPPSPWQAGTTRSPRATPAPMGAATPGRGPPASPSPSGHTAAAGSFQPHPAAAIANAAAVQPGHPVPMAMAPGQPLAMQAPHHQQPHQQPPLPPPSPAAGPPQRMMMLGPGAGHAMLPGAMLQQQQQHHSLRPMGMAMLNVHQQMQMQQYHQQQQQMLQQQQHAVAMGPPSPMSHTDGSMPMAPGYPQPHPSAQQQALRMRAGQIMMAGVYNPVSGGGGGVRLHPAAMAGMQPGPDAAAMGVAFPFSPAPMMQPDSSPSSWPTMANAQSPVLPQQPVQQQQQQQMGPPNLLQDLLDEEKRQQQQQQLKQQQQQHIQGIARKADGSLLSEAEYEKLKAEIVADNVGTGAGAPGAFGMPLPPSMAPAGVPHGLQTDMSRFARQGMIDTWRPQSQPAVESGLAAGPMYPQPPPPPPPPPPYPGTERMGPNMIMHPQMQQQQAAMHPQLRFVGPFPVPGPRMPMENKDDPHLHLASPMPHHSHQQMMMQQQQRQYEDWLRHHNLALSDKVHNTEKRVAALKKTKKSLTNKQKQLKKNNEDLSLDDAQKLEQAIGECSALQKELDKFRKEHKQHQLVVQDYQHKQERLGYPPAPPMVGPSPVPNAGGGSGQAGAPVAPSGGAAASGMQPAGGCMPPPPPATPTPHGPPTGGTAVGIPGPSGPSGAASHPPHAQQRMRMPQSARREYDLYMQQRLQRQQEQHMHPAPPSAGALPLSRQPQFIGNDNNPFSDSYHQRERLEKMRELEEKQRASLAAPSSAAADAVVLDPNAASLPPAAAAAPSQPTSPLTAGSGSHNGSSGAAASTVVSAVTTGALPAACTNSTAVAFTSGVAAEPPAAAAAVPTAATGLEPGVALAIVCKTEETASAAGDSSAPDAVAARVVATAVVDAVAITPSSAAAADRDGPEVATASVDCSAGSSLPTAASVSNMEQKPTAGLAPPLPPNIPATLGSVMYPPADQLAAAAKPTTAAAAAVASVGSQPPQQPQPTSDLPASADAPLGSANAAPPSMTPGAAELSTSPATAVSDGSNANRGRAAPSQSEAAATSTAEPAAVAIVTPKVECGVPLTIVQQPANPCSAPSDTLLKTLLCRPQLRGTVIVSASAAAADMHTVPSSTDAPSGGPATRVVGQIGGGQGGFSQMSAAASIEKTELVAGEQGFADATSAEQHASGVVARCASAASLPVAEQSPAQQQTQVSSDVPGRGGGSATSVGSGSSGTTTGGASAPAGSQTVPATQAGKKATKRPSAGGAGGGGSSVGGGAAPSEGAQPKKRNRGKGKNSQASGVGAAAATDPSALVDQVMVGLRSLSSLGLQEPPVHASTTSIVSTRQIVLLPPPPTHVDRQQQARATGGGAQRPGVGCGPASTSPISAQQQLTSGAHCLPAPANAFGVAAPLRGDYGTACHHDASFDRYRYQPYTSVPLPRASSVAAAAAAASPSAAAVAAVSSAAVSSGATALPGDQPVESSSARPSHTLLCDGPRKGQGKANRLGSAGGDESYADLNRLRQQVIPAPPELRRAMILPSPPLIGPRLDVQSRLSASPDTVLSSSSPECEELPTGAILGSVGSGADELPLPYLRLIRADAKVEEEEARRSCRASPALPLLAPVPVRRPPSATIASATMIPQPLSHHHHHHHYHGTPQQQQRLSALPTADDANVGVAYPLHSHVMTTAGISVPQSIAVTPAVEPRDQPRSIALQPSAAAPVALYSRMIAPSSGGSGAMHAQLPSGATNFGDPRAMASVPAAVLGVPDAADQAYSAPCASSGSNRPSSIASPPPSYSQVQAYRRAAAAACIPASQPPPSPLGEQTTSASQDGLKATAAGIKSSLQSAMRQSPSQQVSFTLTLSSTAAQDIPSVLSALADLLRMAVPTAYTVSRSPSPPSQILQALGSRTRLPSAAAAAADAELGTPTPTSEKSAIETVAGGNGGSAVVKQRACSNCGALFGGKGDAAEQPGDGSVLKPAAALKAIASQLSVGGFAPAEKEPEIVFCGPACRSQWAIASRKLVQPLGLSDPTSAAAAATAGSASTAAATVATASTAAATAIVTAASSSGVSNSNFIKKLMDSSVTDAKIYPEITALPVAVTAMTTASPPPAPAPPVPARQLSQKATADAVAGPTQKSRGGDKQRRRRLSSEHATGATARHAPPPPPPPKKWKGRRWRHWDCKFVLQMQRPAAPSKDMCLGVDRGHSFAGLYADGTPPVTGSMSAAMLALLNDLRIIFKPDLLSDDRRQCLLCHKVGDGESHGPARLLNYDADKWIHLNCALWSSEVYETLNGALMNVEIAVKRGGAADCVVCRHRGATMNCFKQRCPNTYHLGCALLKGCMFFQDKTMLCPVHMPREHDEQLKTIAVYRKVYINRNEAQQLANVVHELDDDRSYKVRVGALVFHSVGQLFIHQISTGKFHCRDHIYPVGYRATRYYWSMRRTRRRARYECSIGECDGRPEFTITIRESGYEDLVLRDSSAQAVWSHVLERAERLCREAGLVKIFPAFLTGEHLFGLTEPCIVRVIESLPGAELLSGYAFKFGRAQLIEMPLAINPTGCARSEPKLRTHFRRPHTVQTSSRSHSLPSTVTGFIGDVNSPYMKQFVHSKSQQYRRLKTEWRNYVYLGRSRIQGLGLFAARDIEKHTMMIEYIGEIIRNELAELREKIYEKQNRGVYMFRITPDLVCDATMAGGPARYVNHSCAPNCVAEIVNLEKECKIIIIANRRLAKGEELTYDYKFDFEDDQHKIPCNCGAPNCRKWMN